MEIFIGSSSRDNAKREAIRIASVLEDLKHKPIFWDEAETFTISRNTWDILDQISNRVQAAIFIFSKDDKMESVLGNNDNYSVRDNVILEFGFFTGKLGIEKVAFVKTEKDLHIATDLNGLTYIEGDSKYKSRLKIMDWLEKIENKNTNENNKTVFANNYSVPKDYNNIPINQSVVSTGYNNIPINSHNINSSYNNGSVNTTVAQTNYNSAQPTNSNKYKGGVQFTFYGVSDYASSITEFFVKIVEMIMKKYPDRINDILKNNPIISTTTVGLKYSKNGDVYRKIVINGITYYVGTSTDTNTKKSQLRNIFRSIGIEPTMDVITIDGKAL